VSGSHRKNPARALFAIDSPKVRGHSLASFSFLPDMLRPNQLDSDCLEQVSALVRTLILVSGT
jgi:hypothetical protein